MTGLPSTLPDTEAWQRLDKRMLLIEPVQAVLRFLPAIIVVVFAGSATRDQPWWVNLGIVIVPILVGVASWATTSYRITDEHLALRRGLIQRNTLTARLDRVRTVDVTASPLHRILGVATVKIGTGGDSSFDLDGLAAGDARELRAQLLHVAREASPASASTGAQPETAPAGPDEYEIARFDPAWIRYAPFSLTGIVAVLAAAGFLAQFANEVNLDAFDNEATQQITEYALGLTLTVLIVQGVIAGFVLVAFAATVAYVLRYWGYRLSRHARGTVQVSRGLLTTRLTTLEERRLRGVVLTRPFLLSLVGGARAGALVTGGASAMEDDGSGLLIPPAPRARVDEVAAIVTRDPEVLSVLLRRHGPAARRRRHIRSVVAAVVLSVPIGVAIWWFGWSLWFTLLPAVLLLTAPFLAAERYRRLGHALTGEHLVAREGLFPEERHVLRTSGIIGWTMAQTFFQRRVGLATLSATHAATGGRVVVTDVTVPDAVALIRASTPGLLDPFLDHAHATATEPVPAPLPTTG